MRPVLWGLFVHVHFVRSNFTECFEFMLHSLAEYNLEHLVCTLVLSGKD